jgi:hypothetical protein
VTLAVLNRLPLPLGGLSETLHQPAAARDRVRMPVNNDCAATHCLAGHIRYLHVRHRSRSPAPLGPERWPQDLHNVLRVMLRSKFPTYLVWALISSPSTTMPLSCSGARDRRRLCNLCHKPWAEIWEVIAAYNTVELGTDCQRFLTAP